MSITEPIHENIIENFNQNFNEDDNIKIIIDKADNKLTTIMENWCNCTDENYAGGKMRGMRGDDVENFTKEIIKDIGETFKVDVRAIKGSSDKKQLLINHNNKVIKKDHQVDIHIYKNNEFVAVIECKAYLDSCYYVRACDDFRLFKKYGYNLKTFLFTLEDSIDEDSKTFIDVDNGFVCDEVFYMLDGKRSSNKPIYDKKYKKPINKEKLTHFVKTLKTLLVDT
jgi:hypothetical protein